jgi:hypothetical protein
MAMTAQEYLDTFNAAINAGAYDSAANILKAAEGDFGPGVYDVAGVVLESNASLPPEIDFMTPQGIQSIRDYVNTATAPAPVASYGPPSPAVSPVVSNSISLTPAGIAALAPSANVPSPANVFSPADYGPPSPPSAAPPTASPAEIQRMQAQRAEAELLRLREAERPIVDPRPQPTVDPVDQQAGGLLNQYYAAIDAGDIRTARNLLSQAQTIYGPETLTNVAQDMLSRLNQTMTQAKTTGDFTGAAKLVEAAGEIYGGDALQNIADYLNTDPQLLDANKGARFTPQNLVQFIQQGKIPAAQTESVTPEGAAAPPTAQTTPGPGQIYGVPRFERQTQSNVPFAPLRRGLAQLRPAMYMPGLTSGQAPLGGSGFTPESLRNAIKSMTAAGQTPADVAYQMDVGGVSPAELSAAIGTPVGQIQAQYNQSRPRGLFSTGAPAPRGLPEDFALQTGAYGAPTPTFLNRNATAAGNTAAGPAGVDQPTYAQLLDNVQRLSAQVQPLINRGQVDYGGGEVGFSQEESGRGFFGDMAAAANAMGFGPDPSNDPSNDPSSGFTGSVSGTGSPGDDGVTGGDGVDYEVGGLIKMAEGGGPPKMAELSAKKAGSTFDISKYIDDEGRLVGGYSKPIYDENRVITGYEYRPYERDVVFGKELRDKEAAMRLTDAERKQMMIEMAMRQGRTGISPTTGGLAGIEIGDPMMRRRPQYYSTVEQFRPRYAEGGLANVAQNLADRGRKGDSMLVHMAPEEVAGLRALARAQGTDMTINPRTGLPEAFSLKKLFKAASFILPFVPIPGLFGMSSLLTKSIFSGIAAGASAKGGFDLKQALGGGLRAYALGSLGEKMGGAPTPDGAPTAPTTTSVPNAAAVDAAAVTAPTVTVPGVDGDISLAGSYTGLGSTPLGPQSLNANLTAPLKVGSSYGFQAATDVASAPIFEAPIGAAGGRDIPLTGGALPPGADTVPGRMANVITPEGQGFGKPITKGFDIAAAGLGGFSLEKAAEETRRAEIEAATVKQKEEERERLFEELARRTLGRVNVKSGGQINLAKGGMTYMEGGGTTDVTGEPRMVQGTGDGMSDSVPATIEGIQEARLANDEFVIPADVVADIGNGSSNAGAKKLYNAMDRIRKARHGTTKQPPEIRAERLMPA